MHRTKRAVAHIYHPQRSWGKVIFSQVSVILLTGGGASSQGAGVLPAREVLPPGGCFLPGGAFSRGVLPLRGCFLPGGWGCFLPGGASSGGAWWRPHPRTATAVVVCNLLECVLVNETVT